MLKQKHISFDKKELTNKLLPMLSQQYLKTLPGTVGIWAQTLSEKCQQAFSCLLPFTEIEMEFLDRLLDHGEIKSTLICDDNAVAQNIDLHPALKWVSHKVKQNTSTTFH